MVQARIHKRGIVATLAQAREHEQMQVVTLIALAVRLLRCHDVKVVVKELVARRNACPGVKVEHIDTTRGRAALVDLLGGNARAGLASHQHRNQAQNKGLAPHAHDLGSRVGKHVARNLYVRGYVYSTKRPKRTHAKRRSPKRIVPRVSQQGARPGGKAIVTRLPHRNEAAVLPHLSQRQLLFPRALAVERGVRGAKERNRVFACYAMIHDHAVVEPVGGKHSPLPL